jgi:hypothetical protein
MIVTSSHIPDGGYGIIFNRADGKVLKPDEMAMSAQAVVLPNVFDGGGKPTIAAASLSLINGGPGYVARYVVFSGSGASELTLGIYEHSAVRRDLLVVIVEALGERRYAWGVPTSSFRSIRKPFGRKISLWAAEGGEVRLRCNRFDGRGFRSSIARRRERGLDAW